MGKIKQLVENKAHLDSLDSYIKSLEEGVDFGKLLTIDDIAEPDSGDVKDILKQRQKQRDGVFKFALRITYWSLGLFTSIVGLQAFIRVFYNPEFEVLGGHGLEVVAVSIFAQSLGVIIIIAKSIWDDTPYKDILEKTPD